MVARPFRCDPSLLRPLLEDRLEEAEQAALARHLETCDSCRLGLERMAAESRWWGDARLLAGDTEAPPASPSHPDPSETEPPRLDFLEAPAEAGQLGKLGPYEVTEVIGRGGMGVVLKAFDRPLGRFVAIKVLAPELATSATARRRFAREAQAVAAIAHDHIVAIHAVDETAGGLPYLVMQYVSGRSLQERLDRAGPLELRAVLRIGMQAASGLAAAHAVGLVHRDVKPANILLENCVERVKLTDFGLARAADDASLTQSGVVAGTPQYMAPEQARGEPVDARADLFSLGSVLHALCTGRPPFRAETTMGVLRRVCEDTPRPIREVNPEVPDWLQAIIARLQAKEPASRFASAAEVADLFGRCLAFLEHPDRPPPFLADPTRPPRRKARARIVGALMLVVAITGLGAAAHPGLADLADYVALVLRIKTPEGTLVIQVDDPEVKVRVDGEDVVFTGAGPREVRLRVRAGQHRVEKTKGGVVRQDLITIARGGKETVRAILEADPTPAAADSGAPTPGGVEPHDARGEIDRKTQAADPAVKRLEERIRALEGELQARVRIDPLERQLKRARAKLVEVARLVRNESDPALIRAKKEVKSLEAELARRALTTTPNERKPSPATAESRTSPLPLPRDVDPSSTLTDPRILERIRSLEAALRARSQAGSLDAQAKTARSRFDELRSRDARREIDPARVTLAALEYIEALEAALARCPRPGAPSDAEKGEATPPAESPGRLTGGIAPIATPTIVLAIAVSPDGKTLAAGCRDGSIRLWDLPSRRLKNMLVGRGTEVRSVAFSPDGKTLASAGGNDERREAPGEAKLWDLAEGRVRHDLVGHTGPVWSIAFSPDGATLATGSSDKTARLWDVSTGKTRAILEGHTDAIRCVAFSLTTAMSGPGETLATGSLDGDVKFWHNAPGQPHDGKMWTTHHTAEFGVTCIAFSADDRTTLAISPRPKPGADRPGEVILLDMFHWKERARLKGHRHAIFSLAFSPDGATLASGGGISEDSGDIGLWDVAAGREKARISDLDYWIKAVAFTPDGKTLISGGGNRGEIRFWDPSRPSQ